MGRQQILRPFAASILSKPFINGEIDQQRLVVVRKFVGEKVSNDDDRHIRMSQKAHRSICSRVRIAKSSSFSIYSVAIKFA